MMFWKRIEQVERDLSFVKKNLDKIIKRTENILDRNSIVSCMVCRCMVEKKHAYTGEKTVRTKSFDNGVGSKISKDYVHTDYYCEIHAPRDGSNG